MELSDPSGAAPPLLPVRDPVSVVIIARNEERFIRQCITSCLEAVQGMPGTEVILVDSRSTDRTIEYAREYPITVLVLGVDQVLSPAAGRYVGYRHARGTYLLFIDGDMVLDREWLRAALPLFDRIPGLAGINGVTVDCAEGGSPPAAGRAARPRDPGGEEVTVLNGAALFRKEALERAGCYHPFLKGAEEAELSLRIRSHGYRLVRLGIPMVCHLGETKYSRLSLVRVSYFQGIGQILRGSLRMPYRRDIFTHFFPYIVNMGFVYASLALLAAGILGSRPSLWAFLALQVSLLILALIRHRRLERAVQQLIRYYLKSWYITRGFAGGMGRPEEYPATEVMVPQPPHG
jgi:glycosyltransferase involved in cell wall biosynthesis